MNTKKICQRCGKSLVSGAPGNSCPKCAAARERRLNSPAQTKSAFGTFVPPRIEELAPHFPQLELVALMGHGGMGAVYKAKQPGLGRLVALKILPPELGRDAMFAERFVREARTLARLNHPNIVTIHDFGQASGYYYFLMEFVDGPNLRNLLSARRLPPEEALKIVPQVCEALEYAHQQGVVHRDIKPENILMHSNGRAKIADFGLARLLGTAPIDTHRLTLSEQVLGTPHYMAPEQFESPHSVDHRADIYSLGVVFYEMLTGELPLGRFEPPSHRVSLDVRLDDIVLRSLEKNPQRRYQHAGEVKTQIEHLATNAPQKATAPPGPEAPTSDQTPVPIINHITHGLSAGFEYRSAATLFGLPLLHVAFGCDPSGAKRTAKGIIAIGEIARGFLAIGGLAMGIVAIGGISLGVLGMGALALGVVASGGVAVGLAAGFGGVAIAPVASGMLAIGYYGRGLMAFGAHTMAATGADQVAQNMFRALESLGALKALFKGMPGFVLMLTFGFVIVMTRMLQKPAGQTDRN